MERNATQTNSSSRGEYEEERGRSGTSRDFLSPQFHAGDNAV
jgi:hypothetical protein